MCSRLGKSIKNRIYQKSFKMKYSNFIASVLAIVILVMSCGRSPYKRRHRCRGNGSWYGHRNLGAIDKINKEKNNQMKFVWKTETNKEI